MNTLITSILILGFRVAWVGFLIFYPLITGVVHVLTRPWVYAPIMQGLVYVLKPLTFLSTRAAIAAERVITLEVNRLDINEVTLEELLAIEGLGHTKAQDIIIYLDEYGPLKRMEELGLIRGIGSKTFRLLCDHFTVYGSDDHIRAKQATRTKALQILLGRANAALAFDASVSNQSELEPQPQERLQQQPQKLLQHQREEVREIILADTTQRDPHL